jgi:hypothetical protein
VFKIKKPFRITEGLVFTVLVLIGFDKLQSPSACVNHTTTTTHRNRVDSGSEKNLYEFFHMWLKISKPF